MMIFGLKWAMGVLFFFTISSGNEDLMMFGIILGCLLILPDIPLRYVGRFLGVEDLERFYGLALVWASIRVISFFIFLFYVYFFVSLSYPLMM